MILASSSITRAKILKEANITFLQIPFNYNETKIKKIDPLTFTYDVVRLKKSEFLSANKDLKDDILFADSCVVCENKILTKAKSDEEAYDMLILQSNNKVSVISSFIYLGKKEIINSSITTFKFLEFKKIDIKNYIDKKEYLNKAGAMSIEGFNKKYILSQTGNTSTAMGLNIEILKAFL